MTTEEILDEMKGHPQYVDIWIGRPFYRKIREICISDRSTGREIHTLLTEEQAKMFTEKIKANIIYKEGER
jgi:hypothetical protein